MLRHSLGERHIKLLRRFVDQVILVLDGDEAGRKRADEVLELFVAADLDMLLLTLPDELDPAESFCSNAGPRLFEAALGTAVDALEHKFRCVTENLGGESSIHAVQRQSSKCLPRSPKLRAATRCRAPRG